MKQHKILPYIVTILVTLAVAFAAVALLLRPRVLAIKPVDLTTVADGAHIGICQNKILLAVVRVEVKDHKITGIEILQHTASYMKQAQQIADAVCAGQTLNVDAVAGATLTSSTVLKAIETALE